MPIEITMPRLSDTMETGTIIKWNVAEGQAVSAGDVVADIETDKATMEMQVFDDGTVASLLVPEGQAVDVGTVIALLAEEDESADDVAAAKNGASAKPPASGEPVSAAPASAPQAAVALVDDEPSAGDGRFRVSPVARRLADEHGIDLRQLQGTGPSGRIIKRDVQQAIETGLETAASVPPSALARPEPAEVPPTPVTPAASSTPVPTSPLTLQSRTVPVSNMRQTIARRLVESKTTIPHYQVTMAFDVDALLEMRAMLNDQLGGQGVKLSVNDFLIRGCALAMYEHPEFNASWAGDSIEIHGDVNIGVAVALPAERGGGLVVATIRHADQKSLRTISIESRQLALKARERGLSLEEMSDSTFTLSNLGMFGVEHFTAIINPPNSAILAVGAAIEQPVVKDGVLTIGHRMQGTLSSDHRVIDGAMSARYLTTLKELIENPATMMV